MKKILSIFVLAALVATFALTAFADGNMECPNCGRMSVVTRSIGTYETGPVFVPCIHKAHGEDAVYTTYTQYQDWCSCGYRSAPWSRPTSERRVCHGYN